MGFHAASSVSGDYILPGMQSTIRNTLMLPAPLFSTRFPPSSIFFAAWHVSIVVMVPVCATDGLLPYMTIVMTIMIAVFMKRSPQNQGQPLLCYKIAYRHKLSSPATQGVAGLGH